MYNVRWRIPFYQSQPRPSSPCSIPTINGQGPGGVRDPKTSGLNEDEGLDPTTMTLIAELLYKDLEELNFSRKGKACRGIPLTDAEYAIQVQSEQLESMLHEVNDADIAERMQEALRVDHEVIGQILLCEKVALQDREFALALSRGEEMPMTTVEQEAMEGRVKRDDATLTDMWKTLSPEFKPAPIVISNKGRVRTTPPVSSFLPHSTPNLSLELPSQTMTTTGIEDFLRVARPPSLDYPHLRSLIIPRPLPNTAVHPSSNLFEKIVCPYNADAFERMLVKHDLTTAYPDLISNLRLGFPLGDMGMLTETRILDNVIHSPDHWPLIDEYLRDEVTSGRMDGPFSRSDVESILRGPFQASPLLVVSEPQAPGEPNKTRVCQNLSKSRNGTKRGSPIPSVNSFIDKESFPTRFDTTVRISEALSLAPPGAQACTFDIQKFHRTCPVSPHHKHWLVVQGRTGQFYINHVHPFGVTSASSNAGMIANAAIDIWRAEGADPTFKYEDDISQMRYPVPDGPIREEGSEYRYKYNREGALSLISSLGIPWHPEKGTLSYSHKFVFIGFEWDAQLKTVSLPEQKGLKFIAQAESLLSTFSSGTCDLRDVERIHGALCHVSFVYTEGRPHLSSLSNFAASFEGDTSKSQTPPHWVLADIRWWLKTLQNGSFSHPLSPLGPDLEVGLYVDASTSWGIGLVIDGSWMAFRLLPGWNTPKVEDGVRRNIAWLETVAVELLAYALLHMGFFQCRIRIHSDNMGVIGAMTKGRSPNYHINLSVRRTYSVLIPALISPSFVYIESGSNPADPISRGMLPSSPPISFNFTLPHNSLLL